MAASDSDDDLFQQGGSEDEYASSLEGDSGSEDEQQPASPRAAKKRRVENGADSLGLELLTGAHAAIIIGGGAAGAAQAAADIDGSQEAEASLLNLEVGELLKEVRPDIKLEAALLALLRQLAALLRALPDAEVAPQESASIKGFLADLAFTPVRPFVFQAPARVQVVGSFGLRSAVRRSPCVDMALLMPADCFDNKDQLNHRYHAKRALYLAHIAAALKGHPQLTSISWECLANDPRRPVLLLHPQAGLSPAGCTIRLLPAAPLELCPLQRLAPHRNNLRAAAAPVPAAAPPVAAAAAAAATAAGKAAAKGGKQPAAAKGSKQQQPNGRQQQAAKGGKQQQPDGKGGKQQQQPVAAQQAAAAEQREAQLLPTPHYNTSVLQDMLMLPLDDTCRAVAARCPHFADAAALLRVWARQQQLSVGADCLSSCLLSLLLVHLVESGQAGAAMTAMHLFRTVLVALSKHKTFSPGLVMQWRQPGGGSGSSGGGGSSTAAPPDTKAWRRQFEVVFVDTSGWMNLAAGVSRAALQQARACAARSLQLLNGGTTEAFDAVFLARRRQAATCDYWFHVRAPAAAAAGAAAGGGSSSGTSSSRADLQRDQPAWRSLEQQVEALASKALGTRARLVRAFRRTLPAGGSSGSSKAGLRKGAARPEQQHVLLGVQVDPTAALRTLDMGPAADKADAARAFRAFWGDKAELRRFQDGAIAEAVVWEEGGVAERHLIIDRIITYILQRHLPAGTSVCCHAGALDAALARRHSTPEADARSARLCEGAAERLGKRLRTLTGDSLPLRVVTVQPLAAVLRHTAVFPPLPHLLAGAPADSLASDHVARCLDPVELLCTLEGSGKWPDSLEAYAKMKAAMGCQLAQQLQQALGMEAQASEDYVDVLTDGFAFRLLLATERDAAMQQKALAISGEVRVPVEEDMQLRAWHQGAMSGVAGENPAFEPSVRLAKRWVAAHLLSPHLAPEATELIVAHCFTSSSSGGSSGSGAAGGSLAATASAPGSRTAGLLRFLHLLAEQPWRLQPLLVDPNNELSAAQRDAIVRQHGARRALGAAPALCLATPRDPGGGVWTQCCPTAQVLHRIVVLAQRSAAALEQLLLLGGGGDGGGDGGEAAPAAAAQAAAVAAVFSRDLGEYDVLVRLRADALPNAANDLRLGARGSSTGAAAAAAAAAGRQQLGPALHAANEQLAELAAAAAAAPGSKQCRAVLKGIPQSILVARGHHLVRKELLVGFEPLPTFIHQLQQRVGDLAVCCSDFVGGSLVALKWRPAAFAPAPLRPELGHLVCPAGSHEAAAAHELAARRQQPAAAAGAGEAVAAAAAAGVASGKQDAGQGVLSAAAVVPDVVGLLADVLHMGAGLVESIQLQ